MLQISHLAASYGGKPALEDINLTLDSGELLVVLGPSGCGKTTLLNLIAGFVPYQHGSITLAGNRVDGPGADRGVVFQNEGLLPWRNVQDNVAFGLQLAGVDKPQRQRIALEMLQKVGLEDAGKRFIWQLSGGQRQRVGIARALAANPQLLLLDEPFGALDAFTREQMQTLLLKLWHETGKKVLERLTISPLFKGLSFDLVMVGGEYEQLISAQSLLHNAGIMTTTYQLKDDVHLPLIEHIQHY